MVLSGESSLEREWARNYAPRNRFLFIFGSYFGLRMEKNELGGAQTGACQMVGEVEEHVGRVSKGEELH